MVQEAEKNAEADKEKSKKIELKNTADTMVYQTKKQLSELESRLSLEDKQQIETTIASLEKALAEENYANMETEKDALQKLMLEIGQKVYDTNDAASVDSDVIETP
jgi:molecular chaperone DnaK (HSP70)